MQDQILHNSSGIRTSSRLQAKAWQEMKMHEGAPLSVQVPLQAAQPELINSSDEEEQSSSEESDDSPALVPRPDLQFGLFDAYVGAYGPFAAHDSAPSATHDSGRASILSTGPSSSRKISGKAGKISGEVLAQVARVGKKEGKGALEGFMVLDSASTVFATNDRRNLLPKTIKADKIPIDTGNGELEVQEWGSTYVKVLTMMLCCS